MVLKEWTVASSLVLLVPGAPHAATEANFGANTTGDLVELCAATPDNAIGTAAVNFCQGFAQGAVSVEMQNLAAFHGPKLFCLPNPLPARTETLSEFVKWGPRRARSSGSVARRRFVSVPRRTLPLSAIAVITLPRGIR